MKKLVAIAIIIFAVFMSYVFIGGYLEQRNEKEQNTNTTASTQPTTSDSTQDSSKTSPDTTTKTYAATEVATHGSPNDCWIIIENNIYNVTEFLDEHPGGKSEIAPYCGKDASAAFATQNRGSSGGHSASAKSMLAEFQIGTLQN